MKKTIWIIAGLAIAGLMVFKLASNKKINDSKIYHFDKEKPISVNVDTIRLKTIQEDGLFAGTFEPNREVKISAETQGKINAMLVDVGSYVQRGQKLIQLDNSLLQLQLEAVEVQIEGLKNDVERYTILTEADAVQGVQLEKTKLGLKAAEVQKATLQEQINKTSIRAPFPGVVTAKLSEIGAFAAPGIPLLQITDLNTLKFTINVSESSLSQIQSDQNYIISADILPDIPLSGKLSMIGSKANMGNSFPVQFLVKNTRELAIKSGMFGKAQLSASGTSEGILIPSSAIINSEGQAQVYVVKAGKAQLQTITTSKNIGNNTLIASGLNVDDIIVTNGFINLFDGANINIK